MRPTRILVVDDEAGMLEVCEDSLGRLEEATIDTASSGVEAAEILKEKKYELLVTDLRMPGGLDGLGLIRVAREHDPDLPVVVITAFGSVESAIEAMKLGAVDYLQKPFHPDDLLATVRRLMESRELRDENRMLQRRVDRRYEFGRMVGASEAMQRVADMIDRVADSDCDVLVLGETGTGKELVARSLHERSGRAKGRFVPVDCGAIPPQLLESEFFGHERGAFTGANARSIGLMEYADGGTLFMDEVAELTLPLQAKLLRALQERKIRRVGSTEEIPVNVRIVAATSRDLEAMIEDRSFREDLYYRINVVKIDLPPLRDREGDIPLLVESMIDRYVGESGRNVRDVDSEAMEVLERHSWPGNVRELQNIVRRGIALARGTSIGLEELPEDLVLGAGGRPAQVEVEGETFFERREREISTFEKAYIERMLRKTGGDVTQAARDAALPRGTLYRIMKNHGIQASDFRG